jgi:cytochrome c-type biogenesis protein CcmH
MGAGQSEKRKLSAPTIVLIVAALIAIVSAAITISRALGDDVASEDSPAAEDWRTVGWAWLERGDAERSAAAYRRATRIEPQNAENWSSLGEALQVASRISVPEAEGAFQKALELNPADPRARYFLAAQRDLRGDHSGAITDWLALLKDTPPGAPWEADLRRNIDQTAARNKIDLKGRMPAPGATAVASAAIPGPTPEQLAAASSIPPSQQDQMAQQMVERLANRLKQNPKDAEGWIRLMRSRMVLGQADRASEALRSGLAAFAGDSSAQTRLRSAAAELGVKDGG